MRGRQYLRCLNVGNFYGFWFLYNLLNVSALLRSVVLLSPCFCGFSLRLRISNRKFFQKN